jgi:predicted lipoprotein with Yx(FWY)xxD motif
MRKGTRVACALAAGIGLLGAGCGGEHRAVPSADGNAQPSSAGPMSSPPSSVPPTAGPASPPSSLGPVEIKGVDTSIGKIVVDGRGMTLYIFEKDNAGTSTCTGDCAKEWPPMLTGGQVTPGPDVGSMWVGTLDRPDGTKQVTYSGWPLYYSSKDAKPGDMNGQAVVSNGAPWYVISADKGEKIEKKP